MVFHEMLVLYERIILAIAEKGTLSRLFSVALSRKISGNVTL